MVREVTYKSEKCVKREVRKLLEKHKYFWWMPPSNAFGRTGIADFNALNDGGVFVAIETKFGSNKPTAAQIGYLNSVNGKGAFGFVVSEKTIGSLKVFLEKFDESAEAYAKTRKLTDVSGAEMLEAIRIMTEMLA